jgi:hypothetical protein
MPAMYPSEFMQNMLKTYRELNPRLSQLILATTQAGHSSESKITREHLHHGVSRRLGVIQVSITNIFSVFPPNQEKPLSLDDLKSVDAYLHAFFINVAGIFDNWAWAFIYRHDLQESIVNRHDIGLFKQKTQKHLPQVLRDFLSTQEIKVWYESHLKNYRDALAHRIPLYVPPSTYTEEDGIRYKELESRKLELLSLASTSSNQADVKHKLDEVERLHQEQYQIGTPCFLFMHSFSETDAPNGTPLHPQLLSDVLAVIKFGELFYSEWEGCV